MERYGICPDKLKLYVYWTAERDRDSALMEVPFDEKVLESAAGYFDGHANKIQDKDFDLRETPKPEICGGCDFRGYCKARGIIKLNLEQEKKAVE